METFGERFKKLRLEKRLTQDKLAEMFFLNKSSISRYENNFQIPELELLNKFAQFFEVSVDYLLGRTDIRNPEKEILKEEVPEQFTDPDQARAYVKKHRIFSSDGFNADKIDDEKILEFANALLEQMKLVGYKYKK